MRSTGAAELHGQPVAGGVPATLSPGGVARLSVLAHAASRRAGPYTAAVPTSRPRRTSEVSSGELVPGDHSTTRDRPPTVASTTRRARSRRNDQACACPPRDTLVFEQPQQVVVVVAHGRVGHPGARDHLGLRAVAVVALRVHADEVHPLPERDVHRLEVRHLTVADTAPGGGEVQHGRLAGQRGAAERPTREFRERHAQLPSGGVVPGLELLVGGAGAGDRERRKNQHRDGRGRDAAAGHQPSRTRAGHP